MRAETRKIRQQISTYAAHSSRVAFATYHHGASTAVNRTFYANEDELEAAFARWSNVVQASQFYGSS